MRYHVLSLNRAALIDWIQQAREALEKAANPTPIDTRRSGTDLFLISINPGGNIGGHAKQPASLANDV